MHLLDMYDHMTEKRGFLYVRFIHEHPFLWVDKGLKRTEDDSWRRTNADDDEASAEFVSKQGDVAVIVGLQLVYHPNYLGAIVIDVPRGKVVRRHYLPYEDGDTILACDDCSSKCLPHYEIIERKDLASNEIGTLKAAKRYDFNERVFHSNTDKLFFELCSVPEVV